LIHFDIGSALTAITLLLAITSLSLLAFGRLGLGMVVAFIGAGILLGQFTDLPQGTVSTLREATEFGVVLLLFLIGVELEPKELNRLGRDVAIWGTAQILFTGLLIGIYAWLVVGKLNASIIIGLGFALSSTTLVIQMLKDRGELDSPWGRKALAILIAQDLAIVPLLLLVPLLAESPGANSDRSWLKQLPIAIAALVVIVVIGRFVLPRLLRLAENQKNDAAFSCLTLLSTAAAALISHTVGLSMALGAFLLGLTLSISPYRHKIVKIIEPGKGLLLSLFFISIGLSLDLRIFYSDWFRILLHTSVLLTLKMVAMFVVAIVARLSAPDALRLSSVLSQSGEFAFVLFAAAISAGPAPYDGALYSALIILSMLATPFLMHLADRLILHFAKTSG
jgi:glutathione-regulated potassium-efflux system ancillary protein KefC